MKTVTPETLAAALRDASSGYDVYAAFSQQAKAIYDALPTPPLAEEVQAAVRVLTLTHSERTYQDGPPFCDKCGRPWPCETATIITALHAATAASARLREALAMAQHMASDCECSSDAECCAPHDIVKETTAALALPMTAGAERLLRLAALVEDEAWWAEHVGIARYQDRASNYYASIPHETKVLLAAIKAKVEEA